MGDVLAKLGVFDLIAVLLSGFSALTISILLLTMTCAVEIDEAKFHFMGLEALPTLVMSYLFGLALQEIGSFLERIIYHGGLYQIFYYENCVKKTEAEETHGFRSGAKDGESAI